MGSLGAVLSYPQAPTPATYLCAGGGGLGGQEEGHPQHSAHAGRVLVVTQGWAQQQRQVHRELLREGWGGTGRVVGPHRWEEGLYGMGGCWGSLTCPGLELEESKAPCGT